MVKDAEGIITDFSDVFHVYREGNDKPKTVPILGAPRGGTSMLARVLLELGVNMGDDLANGYQLEDMPFKQADVTPEMIETAKAYDNKYDIWGWKYPNSIYYIKRLERYLRRPHYIIIIRNPLAIGLSSARRDKDKTFTPSLASLGFEHTRRALNFSERTTAPTAFCSYENAIRFPEIFIRRLITYLHIEPSTKQIESALNIINPNKGYTHI